ncbi:hypothetical protein K443DRAFT_674158 [Laccaria amethystina LaAM-08-1]|uniref:Chromatin assembly factor 1 subunit A dimerization domain-containing protein n=1 Tax=Laccaria amethystina LaAM-08-1 TaxID=1095629 RepID=A0A0C9XY30_9AGAR|nr:hypothetical protein K443DRAFT_674158 [Laccaria amethystina LaAM-08-1]
MSSSETNKATTSGLSSSCTLDINKPEIIPIIELKNGKVVCKQKCISFEKQSETLQEIVKFREMLEGRIEKQQPPLDVIPDEHQPLIAKLAHESDKTLGALAKHIHHELLPTQDEDEEIQKASSATLALPLKVVESAIKLILLRNNYGLDFGNAKPPAAVSVWRWEVKDKYREWLPKNGREKAEARLAERVRAKEDLKLTFNALPQTERDKIFDVKIRKIPTKEINTDTTLESEKLEQQSDELMKPSPQQLKQQVKQKSENVENDATTDSVTPKAGRTKKALDPEKAAKEKERLEKKAAKVEKEKKEKDAQSKSRFIMANFFAKPKAFTSSRASSNEVELAIAGPSQVQSEFSKSFKPFVLKKDATLAPINWFLKDGKQRRRHVSSAHANEVITIDCDDGDEERIIVNMQDCQSTKGQTDLGTMSARDRLDSILVTLPPSAEPSRHLSRRNRQFKTHNPVAVRDIVSQLSEAEIIGDDALVRSLLEKLRNRTIVPAKVLIFTEDARPGYFGTWSRSSRIIGPRTPLAKDVLVFDYAYDSGEEWEEEAAGDADDLVDDGEDEDPENEDVDSDLDSWLVDDDEDPMSLNAELTPPEVDFTPHSTKRKADDEERRLGKKRKVVVPLVPFVKGPYWETTLGVCPYDPFKSYRLQLFNDTPFPVDPFTFVSSCIDDQQSSAAPVPTIGDGVFIVPSLPSRLTAPNNSTFIDCTPFVSSPGSSVTAPKKPAPTPKTPFPDTHLPFLLDKITQLQASSFLLLVEAIYHDLRGHKVTKISIEAKVKEVGEKCKEKKIWVVKPSILATQVP